MINTTNISRFLASCAIVITPLLGFAEALPALISVNGTSEIAIEPNMVIVQVESWGKATTAEEAQNFQAEQFKKLKSALEKFKIGKDELKSLNYNIYPDYFYDQKNQTNKIVAYRVSHQLSIALKKIDQAGNLFDVITNASTKSGSGATVQSINWDNSNRSDFEKQGLESAVQRARTKADILAAASNVKIRRVYRISYNSGGDFTPAPQMEMAQMKAMTRTASTELAPGQIKLSTTVLIDFEIQ